MDDLDLYEEKPHFNAQDELAKINRELEENNLKCQTLREQIAKLVQKNAKLEETQKAIKRNFNSLLTVARNELSEKDTHIINLRREKDDIAFRRTDPNSQEVISNLQIPEQILPNKWSRASQTLTLDELTGDPTRALSYKGEEKSTVKEIRKESQQEITPRVKQEPKETLKGSTQTKSKDDNKSQQPTPSRANSINENKAPKDKILQVDRSRSKTPEIRKRSRDESRDRHKSAQEVPNKKPKRTEERSSDKVSNKPTPIGFAKPHDNSDKKRNVDNSDTTVTTTVTMKEEKRTPSPVQVAETTDPHEEESKTKSALPAQVLNHEFNPLDIEEEHTNPFPQSPEPSIIKDPMETSSAVPTANHIESPTTTEVIQVVIPAPEQQQPPARVEKRTEPLLTSFEGSLKLLNKGELFVKIKSNRTANVMEESTVATPQDGINSSSSSHELHLHISDNCSSPSPEVIQEVADPHPQENNVQNGTSQNNIPVEIIYDAPPPVVEVPMPRPENSRPHNNPAKNKLPLMTVPADAHYVEKPVPIPKEVSPVKKVVKPPPKPKINLSTCPKEQKKPESNLTEANLHEHDLNMKKNEIVELKQEFLQLIDEDDPLLVMAMERAQEKREKMEQKIGLGGVGMASTIAPSCFNTELPKAKREPGVHVPSKAPQPSPESPSNSKENATPIKVENIKDEKPPEEKCVMLGNSQYNISQDAEGTTVIHLKRFKRKAK